MTPARKATRTNENARPVGGAPQPPDGRVRVVIENITPAVDCGRFAMKRVVGEAVEVEADVYADGHDAVRCALLFRPEGESEWDSVPMLAGVNDRWSARFVPSAIGRYVYTVAGWVDHFETWRRDLAKRHAAQQPLDVEFQRGAELARALAARAGAADRKSFEQWAVQVSDPSAPLEERVGRALANDMSELAQRYPDPALLRRHEPPLVVAVDRERARFSAWYELFPRSAAPPDRHGTFADCESRLPYVAAMGFDVLYLPPIHPIGHRERKGPNNRPAEGADVPGSPWAIGGAEGGHTAVHPALGTLEDLRRLIVSARRHGIELALDIAYQCSPDHPYVTQHPEWFQRRPDGTIQYAENPPKKYQDIYPPNFETEAWPALWDELKHVVEFWVEQGVRIFRVDNPHTKPFAFWEWLIAEIKRIHPDVIFLSEAFTRPKIMYRLAKLGFTQSYTYFTWRNTKHELTEYFTELARVPIRDFFRPNLWPNTPDILPEYLQFGGRPAFMVRLVLAATLGASYGIYGPAFELLERAPREPGSEEYLDSEKYQLRHWDLDRSDSLRDLIARVNRIRRENPALQTDRGLQFQRIDNDAVLAYSKSPAQPSEGSEAILVVVNLDPHHAQSGWVDLDLGALGLDPAYSFQAHDLLSDERFVWQGPRNFVALDPQRAPAHVFRLRRRVRSERDFDYFM